MKNFKWIFSFAILLTSVLFLASCSLTANAMDDTYLTIDINPSIELIVNKREKVVYASPLNEDGEVLLAELDLIGLDLEVAMDIIIETATELGFIDVDADETLVQVSAVSSDSTLGEKIRTRAKEHINNAFKDRMMMGRAEDKGFTPEFLAEAESYGVTPGFLALAKAAVVVSDELLLEDALLLTVPELQEILKDAKVQMKEVAQALKNEFMANRTVLYDQYFPQIQSLQEQIVTAETELAALNAELVVKQEALAAAAEENKAAIQVEIDALEVDIQAKVDAIATLTADLEVIRSEFHDAVTVLRDEFHAQTLALREELKNMFQQRKQMYQARYQQYVEEHQAQAEAIRERIRNWQNRP